MAVKLNTFLATRLGFGKTQHTESMKNYVITIWDADRIVHNAKAKAKSPESAKTKCLNDCYKLDKLMGTPHNWLSYRWDIQETITR